MVNFKLFIFVAAFFTGFFAEAQDTTYEKRWEELSRAYDQLIRAPEAVNYEKALVDQHNVIWKHVYELCSASAILHGELIFRAIAIIDEHGVITEFLPLPHSPRFNCFSKNMVGKQYPVPPHGGYLERYSIVYAPE